MIGITNIYRYSTVQEELINGAFSLMETKIDSFITKAKGLSEVGKYKDARAYYTRVNSIYYAIYLAYIIRKNIEEAFVSGNCSTVSLTALKEQYKINCIIEKLACKDINFKAILDYFELSFLYTGELSLNGIGWMIIEGTDCNPFIVE